MQKFHDMWQFKNMKKGQSIAKTPYYSKTQRTFKKIKRKSGFYDNFLGNFYI